MKTKYIFLILIGLLCWLGCSDDNETLTPLEEPKYELSIPQGNHDYDNRITKWFDRTGVYILYKFDPADVYFRGDNEWGEVFQDTSIRTVTYALGDKVYVENDTLFILNPMGALQTFFALGTKYGEDGLWQKVYVEGNAAYVKTQSLELTGTIKVDEALEEYAGKQLTWIEEMFLNFYPDALLRSNMVLKIILGRNLEERSGSALVRKVSFANLFNSLIFSYGDETLETLTSSEKNKAKADVHSWFIKNQLTEKIFFKDFLEVTDYYWVGGSTPSSSLYYSLGIIASTNRELDKAHSADIDSYLRMVLSYSYEQLTQEPANGNYNSSDFTGLLHPTKDVNGLIKRKYDFIVSELKAIGVDLKAVGALYN